MGQGIFSQNNTMGSNCHINYSSFAEGNIVSVRGMHEVPSQAWNLFIFANSTVEYHLKHDVTRRPTHA